MKSYSKLKTKRFTCKILMTVILCIPQIVNSQINLEHTFDGSVTCSGSIHMEQTTYPPNSYYIVSIVENSYVVKIYNSDYSLYSNDTYDFTPPEGYKLYSVSLSRELFNELDDIEFMVVYNKIENVYDNTRSTAILYNQTGSVIKDFGFAYSVYVYPYLHIMDGSFRLQVGKTYYDGTNTAQETEIYSIPGTPPTNTSNLKSAELQSPYPNPANTIITLPYQLKQGQFSHMNIYKLNGKLIETKQIGYDFDKVLLNVSNYTKGVYVYTVNGISSKFIIE